MLYSGPNDNDWDESPHMKLAQILHRDKKYFLEACLALVL